jgi:hypothetical protein
VRNSGWHGAPGTVGAAAAAGLQGQRLRLGVALALSLLAHALLLASLRVPRESEPHDPTLFVTLTGTFRQVPPAAMAPAQVPPPAPLPPAPSQPPPVAPAAIASPTALAEPDRPPAPLPVPLPVPEEAAPPTAAPQRPQLDDQIFLAPGQWTTPPLPQSTPDAKELAGAKLEGRRLAVTLWIDDQGRVRQAEVDPNELSPETVRLLEQLLARVPFTPAAAGDLPVGARVVTRLCIDDAGLLDTTSAGCWRFDGDAAR